MEVRYKDKKIRELCEKQAVAERKLEAATRVTDLVAGNPHPLKGVRLGQFALDLAGGWRLVFSPDHDHCPTRLDGSIEWSQVTIVSIEYIGDYHD